MIFFSILVAVAADRFMTQFHSLRQFAWLQDYADWMNDVLSVQRLPQWVGASVLIAPLLFAVWFLQGIFANGLWGLFEFAFNVVVLFVCLGPKDLDRQVDDYLDALKMQDKDMQAHAAMQLTGWAVSNRLAEQVQQAIEAVLTRANRDVFACVFWFLLLGPLGAIIYRLLDQLKKLRYNVSIDNNFNEQYGIALAMLEWLPARISVVAFMLSGHFEAALTAYKKAADDVIDIDEVNQAVLVSSGMGAIQYHTVSDEAQAIELMKKARGLILRSLIVWLLFVLLVSLV